MVGETMQINMRLPKQMVYDIEYIAQNLKINRNDWIKVKLAELISHEIAIEKNWIMQKIERDYVNGKINDKQFRQSMGFKPTDKLKQDRRRHKIFTKQGTIATKEYLKKMALQE
jgi:hypothetical protein